MEGKPKRSSGRKLIRDIADAMLMSFEDANRYRKDSYLWRCDTESGHVIIHHSADPKTDIYLRVKAYQDGVQTYYDNALTLQNYRFCPVALLEKDLCRPSGKPHLRKIFSLAKEQYEDIKKRCQENLSEPKKNKGGKRMKFYIKFIGGIDIDVGSNTAQPMLIEYWFAHKREVPIESIDENIKTVSPLIVDMVGKVKFGFGDNTTEHFEIGEATARESDLFHEHNKVGIEVASGILNPFVGLRPVYNDNLNYIERYFDFDAALSVWAKAGYPERWGFEAEQSARETEQPIRPEDVEDVLDQAGEITARLDRAETNLIEKIEGLLSAWAEATQTKPLDASLEWLWLTQDVYVERGKDKIFHLDPDGDPSVIEPRFASADTLTGIVEGFSEKLRPYFRCLDETTECLNEIAGVAASLTETLKVKEAEKGGGDNG